MQTVHHARRSTAKNLQPPAQPGPRHAWHPDIELLPHKIGIDPIESRKQIVLPTVDSATLSLAGKIAFELNCPGQDCDRKIGATISLASFIEHVSETKSFKRSGNDRPSNDLLAVAALRLKAENVIKHLPYELFYGLGGRARLQAALRYSIVKAAGGTGVAFDVQELKSPLLKLTEAGLKSITNDYTFRDALEIAWPGCTKGVDPIILPWFLDKVAWHRKDNKDLVPQAVTWLVTVAHPVHTAGQPSFDASKVNNTDWYSILNRLGFNPMMTENPHVGDPLKLLTYSAKLLKVSPPCGSETSQAQSWRVLGQVRNKWSLHRSPVLIDDVTDVVVRRASQELGLDLTNPNSFDPTKVGTYRWTAAYDKVAEGALKYTGLLAAFALGRRFPWWFGVGENQIPFWAIYFDNKWDGFSGWSTARQAVAWSLGRAGLGTIDPKTSTWSVKKLDFLDWCTTRRAAGLTLLEHLTRYGLSHIHRHVLKHRSADVMYLLSGTQRPTRPLSKSSAPLAIHADQLFDWEGGILRVMFGDFGTICRREEHRKVRDIIVDTLCSRLEGSLPKLAPSREVGKPIHLVRVSQSDKATMSRLHFKARGLTDDAVHATRSDELLQKFLGSVGRQRTFPGVTDDDVYDLLHVAIKVIPRISGIPSLLSESLCRNVRYLAYANERTSLRRPDPSQTLRLALLKKNGDTKQTSGTTTALCYLEWVLSAIGRGHF